MIYKGMGSIKFNQILTLTVLSGTLLFNSHIPIIKSDNKTLNQNQSTIFSNSYGVTHYTRYDMEQMLNHQNDKQAQMPNFDASKISDLKSAKDQFHVGKKGQLLDVWDSWPLKNANGEVTNFHGYHITFALTGNNNQKTFDSNNVARSKIYMFYQKVNDDNKGVRSWKSAGPVFKSNVEGSKNASKLLKDEVGEWAGSTIIQNDGRARLFYTSLSGRNGQQTLATASIKINVTKDGLKINHKRNSDRKLIFAGDGKKYETLEQSNTVKKQFADDDHCLRDPNYVEANGHKYLIFDSNTGSNFGAVGENQLNNSANLGGDSQFQSNEINQFNTDKKLKESAAYANGALGIIELNDNYTVKTIMNPLVVFNGVDDEAERPSIIHYRNKWYLFTTTHGWHFTSNNVKPDDAFMLGFSSNKLTGSYKPLNGNGLVLHSGQPVDSRTYSYSYGVIQNANDPFVINNYMSAIANRKNGHATFGPSVLMLVNGDQTSIMQWPTLSQGQTTYSTGVFAKR